MAYLTVFKHPVKLAKNHQETPTGALDDFKVAATIEEKGQEEQIPLYVSRFLS